jgi:hypothetical protein
MLPEVKMNPEEPMTIEERYQYLRRMKKRYQKADRQERSRLLDEMEAYTGLHRKSLIRLLGTDLQRHPRSRERGPTYGPDLREIIALTAQALDYPCAERLQPVLLSTAQHLARCGTFSLTPEQEEQLARISVTTLRRILDSIPRDKPRPLPRSPQDRNPWRRDVPMLRLPYNLQEPGHLEVDLVHHCGLSASGEYVHTLQMVDIATSWVEPVAVLGRSYLVMQDAFLVILERIPFPILELHPDNDAAFFNAHLLRFWQERIPALTLSRSRPYHKNDNRFVEQRNGFLIRSLVGYDRLDTVAQTCLLNQIYGRVRLYFNFFQPVMRLVAKETCPSGDGQSARVKRQFDRPRPPLDRLCETGVLSEQKQQELLALRETINPLQLREEIYQLVEELFSLPNAVPGVTEDVFQTLQCLQIRPPSTTAG